MYAAALWGGLAAAALLAGCTSGQQPRTVYVEVPAPPPSGQVERPRGDCGIDPARMSAKTKAQCGLVSREPAARHCDDPRWWNFYDSDDVRTYLRLCGGGREWVPVPVPAPVPVPVPYEVPGSPPPVSPPPSYESPETTRSPETSAPEPSEPESPAPESVETETGSSEEPPASLEESVPSEQPGSTEDSSTGP